MLRGFDEAAVAELLESLVEFCLGIHDNRTAPGYRLTERLSAEEDETEALRSRDDREGLAIAEEYRVPGIDLARIRAEVSGSVEDIDEDSGTRYCVD